MASLIDTGFLFALLQPRDKNHGRVTETITQIDEEIIIPVGVIVETSYLLASRYGHYEVRRFWSTLQHSPMRLMPLEQQDIVRIHQILDQYQDASLDVVDAMIVALAERLNITTILTVDQRDFRMIRPKHTPYFTLLP